MSHPREIKDFCFHNTNQSTAARISDAMGISITQDLGKYLGVPTLNSHVSRLTFQHIIDLVNNKLSGWKSHTLSTTGRVILAQLVISSIPLYAMQITKLPRSVYDEADKKTRMFIWGRGNKRK